MRVGVDLYAVGADPDDLRAAILDLRADFDSHNHSGTSSKTFETIIAETIVTREVVGAGNPGGSDTQVQFNDSGAFGGDAGMTYNKTTNTLSVDSIVSTELYGTTNGSVAIYTADATGSNDAGDLTLEAGDAPSTNSGGDVFINAGDGGTPGRVVLTTGAGLAVDADGGDFVINTGVGIGAGYRDGDVKIARVGSTARPPRLTQVNTSNIGSARLTGTIATTNATPTSSTTAQGSIYVATNRSYAVTVNVSARRTGGTGGSAGDSASYLIHALVKDIAGTVSIVGQTIVSSHEDQAAWDVALVVSGSDVLLQVTGAADNNITWAFDILYTGAGLYDLP